MRTLTIVALALLAALTLAPPALGQGQQLEIPVYLHENPLHALPETINAKVGDTLVLRVENPEAPGKTVHNLRVCGDPVDGPRPGDNCQESWGQTALIQPGNAANLTVQITKAGQFEYYCYIAGHKDGGMAGMLVVSDGAEKKGMPLGAPLAILALAGLALVLRRLRA